MSGTGTQEVNLQRAPETFVTCCRLWKQLYGGVHFFQWETLGADYRGRSQYLVAHVYATRLRQMITRTMPMCD